MSHEDRSGGTVRPTEGGAAILPYARTVLNALDAIRQTTDELAGLVRGHLTLGMLGSISTPRVDLPGLLAGFHGKHPGIEITLWEGSSDQLLTGVRHGHLDLALVSLGPQAPAGDIAIRILATEPVVVAVNVTHPLARRKTVTVDSLREHALITLPPGTGIRAHIDAACAAAGIAVRIAFEVGDPRLAAELAGQGLGAALLPASAAHSQSAALTILPLTSPRIEGRIALAARAEGPASPATRAFLRHADLVFSLPPNGGRT